MQLSRYVVLQSIYSKHIAKRYYGIIRTVHFLHWQLHTDYYFFYSIVIDFFSIYFELLFIGLSKEKIEIVHNENSSVIIVLFLT